MATAAPTQGLPIFYSALEPLNSAAHAKYRIRGLNEVPEFGKAHAVPATVEEFALLQRHYPIVFSVGDNPVPLALMGLNEGVNVFLDDNGKFTEQLYVPAYIRRYPFMLAQLGPNPQEMSLCFDPTSEAVGPDGDVVKLFEDGKPSEGTQSILKFCESFEEGAQRTGAFLKELQDLDLLMDGEVTIQPEGAAQPHIYRGFKMVNEEKLRELRGDQLRKMTQNGMMTLIMAHLFSLDLMREVYGRQDAQGKVPPVGATN